MANIVTAITNKTLEEISKDLGTSVVIALKQLDKVVTGKTAQSIRTESERKEGLIEISVFGGAGMKYILEGKPANTKLPVEKKGNKFELVQELKDWKNIRNFKGSDFLLARAIAKNPRDPVDIASKALEIFNNLYGEKTGSNILTLVASDFAKEFKKIE